MVNRRQFLTASALAPALLRGAPTWKFGVMDSTLGMAAKPEAVAEAARLGFQGLQVTLGRAPKNTPMPLAVNETQKAYLAESKRHGVALVSTCLDSLHDHCLHSDPYAKQRVAEGLQITKNLGAKIMLIPFFGRCELKLVGDVEKVTKAISEMITSAEMAGVVLGFENTLPAGQNIRVHDEINSPMLKIYYDVGNARNLINVDPAAELKLYGRQRLCQIHLKDKGYLGEGRVDFPAVASAISEIGYKDWFVLETSSPSRDIEADQKRNLNYLRSL